RNESVDAPRRFLLVELAIAGGIERRLRVRRTHAQDWVVAVPHLAADERGLDRIDGRRHVLEALPERNERKFAIERRELLLQRIDFPAVERDRAQVAVVGNGAEL